MALPSSYVDARLGSRPSARPPATFNDERNLGGGPNTPTARDAYLPAGAAHRGGRPGYMGATLSETANRLQPSYAQPVYSGKPRADIRARQAGRPARWPGVGLLYRYEDCFAVGAGGRRHMPWG